MKENAKKVAEPAKKAQKKKLDLKIEVLEKRIAPNGDEPPPIIIPD